MSIINYIGQKASNIAKSVKSLGARVTLIGVLTLGGCDFPDFDEICDFFDPSPYRDLTLEEVVDMISTPEEAQDYINYEIDYASEDVGGRATPLNGASCQSFRKTFNRKRGVCRDGSIAVAAMLKDDGYLPYTLSVNWKNSDNSLDAHSIFVYQKNGKWGSAGISARDFSDPVYDSIEGLAKRVVKQRNGTLFGYLLKDVSLLDLIEGTNEGFVRTFPFTIKGKWGDSTITGSVSKEEGSYEVFQEEEGTHGLIVKTASYTDDIFDNYFYHEQWRNEPALSQPNSTIEWTVLQRAPCRLPTEVKSHSISNFESGDNFESNEHYSDIEYFNGSNIKQSEKVEVEHYRGGNLTRYALQSRTYHPNEVTHTMTTYVSEDGDREFDKIVYQEIDPDGNLISEETGWLRPQ